MSTFTSIPSLDLQAYTKGNSSQLEAFVEQLGGALETIGFVAIKNAGITDDQVDALYNEIKKFFTLPEEVKEDYYRPDLFGQRGYTGKGKEHAKGRSVGDLKEFYQIGQENPDVISRVGYPPNIWPEELPDFKKVLVEIFETLQHTGVMLLRAIADYLKLPRGYFDEYVTHGNSILRPLHYFPLLGEEVPEGAVRAAEHGDINLITLLMGASADGLEILMRDGAWFPVTALPDQIVVNVGDMLARHTNDRLKSTIHRVVNPAGEKSKISRFSIPFFMHPKASMPLNCLDNCISIDNPARYEDITAGEYLEQRLTEIGLKK